ncbi:TPA: Mov34/MPN/PAD-1 family protein [Serratia fonticola]
MDNPEYLKIETGNFSINILKNIDDVWLSYRQINENMPEAFGVLIGSKDLVTEHYKIVEVTAPQKGDRCSRMSFTLMDPEHQRIVDNCYRDSGGELVYRGTWHTHPEGIPYASNIDIKDWEKCKARNKDKQLFFVIIGTEKKALYYFVGENLLRHEF